MLFLWFCFKLSNSAGSFSLSEELGRWVTGRQTSQHE